MTSYRILRLKVWLTFWGVFFPLNVIFMMLEEKRSPYGPTSRNISLRNQNYYRTFIGMGQSSGLLRPKQSTTFSVLEKLPSSGTSSEDLSDGEIPPWKLLLVVF